MREIPLVMPKMSMTMESGQVLSWHKGEGDAVRAGDVVCEVTTDKVNMDVEATVGGTIARIVAQQGDAVPVGEPIAYIASESDDLLEGISVGPAQPTGAVEVADAVEVAGAAAVGSATPAHDQIASPPSRRGPIAAAPWARRRAAELGIDLASISGTGVDGAVTKTDVERAAASLTTENLERPAPFVPQPTKVPEPAHRPAAPDATFAPAFADALRSQRQAVRAVVARKMTESAAVPQFTAFADLDLHALAGSRGRIGWTALLVYAVARTLREHPMLNSTWHDGEPVPADRVGIALAVDTPVGLLAPVLVDPDQLSLEEIGARTKRLVEQARGGRLAADALQEGTFTVSNLGVFGVRAFQALVTPPQVGALSVGAIAEVPVAVRGALTVRTTCTVGLTVDHRAADGADAGRFLADLAEFLAEPARIFAAYREPH